MRPSTPLRGGSSVVLLVCLATGLATLLDQSVLTVAIPSVRTSLHAGTAQVQWIVAAYSLAFAVALVPAGRLGDAHGRRRLLVVGVAVFSAASLIGATAREPGVVVAARLLQGLGAGTANPQVIGLIQDHFVGWRRGRALGAYAGVGAVAGIAAPVVGGAVLATVPGVGAWRWVLLVNVPFGLVAAALGAWGLPRDDVPRARRRRADLDPVGLALLVLVTIGTLVPVVLVSGGGGSTGAWRAPVVAAVASAALLAAWERRYARGGGRPVLLPELFASRPFVLGSTVASLTFGAALGATLVLTLVLQDGFGLSALHAGLVSTPGAVVGALSAVGSWRVVRRWGRTTVTCALVAELAALVAAIELLVHGSRAATIGGLVAVQVVAGAAGGLVAAPNQALTLAHAPDGAHGVAAGFFQVVQRVSSTLCLAALGGVVLAGAAAGGEAAYRRAGAGGLALCAVLVAGALACSALERAPRGGSAHRVTTDPREAGSAPPNPDVLEPEVLEGLDGRNSLV